MRCLTFDPYWGRYTIDMRVDTWYIEPVYWSGCAKGELENLIDQRRLLAHKNIDDSFEYINETLREKKII